MIKKFEEPQEKIENIEYYSNRLNFTFLGDKYYLAIDEEGTSKEVFLIGGKEK